MKKILIISILLILLLNCVQFQSVSELKYYKTDVEIYNIKYQMMQNKIFCFWECNIYEKNTGKNGQFIIYISVKPNSFKHKIIRDGKYKIRAKIYYDKNTMQPVHPTFSWKFAFKKIKFMNKQELKKIPNTTELPKKINPILHNLNYVYNIIY